MKIILYIVAFGVVFTSAFTQNNLERKKISNTTNYDDSNIKYSDKDMRWICSNCGTINDWDWKECSGCKQPFK